MSADYTRLDQSVTLPRFRKSSTLSHASRRILEDCFPLDSVFNIRADSPHCSMKRRFRFDPPQPAPARGSRQGIAIAGHNRLGAGMPHERRRSRNGLNSIEGRHS